MEISVILPTYNPDRMRLELTLTALKSQSLTMELWELIIVDNHSTNRFREPLDLGWHPAARIVSEPEQGLTWARLKGFDASVGDIIVMVDDDNVLNVNYLEKTLGIFGKNKAIGAIGGKSLPLFDAEPPEWLGDFYGNLALRDLGDQPLIAEWDNVYPGAAPIGAGMGIRREALAAYRAKIASGNNRITDRSGDSLSSGGDNDIVLEILKSGWQVGYFPELVLQHIIPAQRMAPRYLARLLYHTNRSWVQLLQQHGISPWRAITKPGSIFRKFKSWLTYQAWKNQPNYIRWRGACGHFDGLKNIDDQ